MPEPIVVLEFVVRDPVSCVNSAYHPTANGGFYQDPAVKAFKSRVAAAARAAVIGTKWPRHLFVPSHVGISYALHDTRLDATSPSKGLYDALEGVLYYNDRIVADHGAPLAVRDGLGKRMVVRVELLEVRSIAEGRRLESERDARRARALLKPKRKKAKRTQFPPHVQALIDAEIAKEQAG